MTYISTIIEIRPILKNKLRTWAKNYSSVYKIGNLGKFQKVCEKDKNERLKLWPENLGKCENVSKVKKMWQN